jgi:AcrR family transcriptional regulator
MPRAPAYDHDQLMAAAYDVLRLHGPVGLSLRPIAARLGVSQPALFKRIGSKHELLAEMQRWATDMTRVLVADLPERELTDGLRRLFRVFARQVRSPRELAHLLSFSALCLADPALRVHAEARHRLLTGAVSAALRRARRPRPAATARALVALLDGVPLAWAIASRGSLERALLESLDIVLARKDRHGRVDTEQAAGSRVDRARLGGPGGRRGRSVPRP